MAKTSVALSVRTPPQQTVRARSLNRRNPACPDSDAVFGITDFDYRWSKRSSTLPKNRPRTSWGVHFPLLSWLGDSSLDPAERTTDGHPVHTGKPRKLNKW
jgi:hypothetical protein